MNKSIILGIDIGGTKTIITLANSTENGYEQIDTAELQTKAHFGAEETFSRIRSTAMKLITKCGLKLKQLSAVGVGTPSIIDPVTKQTSFSINLPQWDQLNLYTRLKEAFDVPVLLDNDVNLAALAELHLGAGRTLNNFLFVAIGTGIGCGIIINKQIYTGYKGASGEMGAMYIMNQENNPSSVMKPTTLESGFSGSGLNKRLPVDLPINEAFEQYLNRCEPGYSVVENGLVILETALLNAVALLAPEALVLGGGVVTKNQWIRSRVHKYLKQRVYYPPLVKIARLGSMATVQGALLVAHHYVLKGCDK